MEHVSPPSLWLNLDRELHNINLKVQRTGRILPVEVDKLFGLVKVTKQCSSNQALLLLRCCGSIVPDSRMSDRQKMIEEMWTFFEKNNIAMDTSHYNACLKVYIENEHDFNPTDYLSDMEKRGVEPNRVTYQHMVVKYCQVRVE